VIFKSIGMHVGTVVEPQAGFIPLLCGIALSVLSLILLIQALVGGSRDTEAFGDLRHPATVLSVLLVYTIFFEILGYIVVTVILSAFVLYILETKWWVATILGLILSIGTYILFDRVLGVPLPSGILEGLLYG
jgi:putative tricarboxylic transport membrane protein